MVDQVDDNKPPRDVAKDSKSTGSRSQFIPVTAETLERALQVMKKFDSERRTVAVVFDHYFSKVDLDLDMIRKKFRPIFGAIRDDQVLIRTDMTHLSSNLEEANSRGYRTLNQAYIIGEKDLGDHDVNTRAATEDVFCCPMTMGCVINNLKRGIFLMDKRILLNKENIKDADDNQSNLKRHSEEQARQTNKAKSKSKLKGNQKVAKESEEQVAEAPSQQQPKTKNKRSSRVAATLDDANGSVTSPVDDSVLKTQVDNKSLEASVGRASRKRKKTLTKQDISSEPISTKDSRDVETRPLFPQSQPEGVKETQPSVDKIKKSTRVVTPSINGTSAGQKVKGSSKIKVDAIKTVVLGANDPKTGQDHQGAQNAPKKTVAKMVNRKIDKDLFDSLSNSGDIVVQLDNLPAKMTVHSLNLMLGTYSLNSSQVIATCRQSKRGRDLMNTRIVLPASSPDYDRILAKDGCRTHCDTILAAKETNFDELKRFMLEHGDKIVRLTTDEKLPSNVIGYRNAY